MSRSNLLSSATFLGLGMGPRPPAASAAAAAAKPAEKAGEKPAAEEDDEARAKREKAEADEAAAQAAAAKKKKMDDDEDDDKDDPEDDDDRNEMDGKKKAGRARIREQARCAAILGSAEAQGRIEAAAELAFTSRMPRQQAIALLAKLPKAAAGITRLDLEASAHRPPPPGASVPTDADKASAGWGDSFAKHALALRYGDKPAA